MRNSCRRKSILDVFLPEECIPLGGKRQEWISCDRNSSRMYFLRQENIKNGFPAAGNLQECISFGRKLARTYFLPQEIVRNGFPVAGNLQEWISFGRKWVTLGGCPGGLWCLLVGAPPRDLVYYILCQSEGFIQTEYFIHACFQSALGCVLGALGCPWATSLLIGFSLVIWLFCKITK